jgi:hypothetical protein
VTADPDQPRRERLRDDSDELMEAVTEIRELEREKRGEEMSTPRFHELAEDIADKSRQVFRLATDEQAQGDALSGEQGAAIEDVPRPAREGSQ